MDYALSDYLNLNISIPGRAESLVRTAFVRHHTLFSHIQAGFMCGFRAQDWNFTTTPQEGLNNRQLLYPRGVRVSRINCYQ